MASFLIDIDELLNPEHIVGDVIDEVSLRLLVRIIINCNEYIIRFPTPVFFPLQIIALK